MSLFLCVYVSAEIVPVLFTTMNAEWEQQQKLPYLPNLWMFHIIDF